jgi:hypothetical protein
MQDGSETTLPYCHSQIAGKTALTILGDPTALAVSGTAYLWRHACAGEECVERRCLGLAAALQTPLQAGRKKKVWTASLGF